VPPSPRPPADVIAEALTIHLGPSTARTAVRTFAGRIGLRPEELSPEDAPRLLEALRPMLRTLLGPQPADSVLDGIRGDLR
jgi:predicted NBD/HSP70 family sugar kinase